MGSTMYGVQHGYGVVLKGPLIAHSLGAGIDRLSFGEKRTAKHPWCALTSVELIILAFEWPVGRGLPRSEILMTDSESASRVSQFSNFSRNTGHADGQCCHWWLYVRRGNTMF